MAFFKRVYNIRSLIGDILLICTAAAAGADYMSKTFDIEPFLYIFPTMFGVFSKMFGRMEEDHQAATAGQDQILDNMPEYMNSDNVEEWVKKNPENVNPELAYCFVCAAKEYENEDGDILVPEAVVDDLKDRLLPYAEAYVKTKAKAD